MQTEQTENIEYNAPNLKEKIDESATSFSPTPNNPPWNSWAALGVWFASVILIIVLPNIVLLPYLISKGQDLSNSAAMLDFLQKDSLALLLNILAIIPAHILTILVAWLVVTNFRKFSFTKMLGWESGGFVWWHYIAILIAFFGVAAVVGHFIPQQENDFLRILQSSRAAVFAVAFMATFTAPLVEEVVYRGVLYSAFQRTFGVAASVIVVTGLFALVHVPQYYPSYSTIILICLLSLILTLIRVKTDNLLPCIILHTIFNGFQSILLVADPYLPKEISPLPEQASAIIKFFS